MKRFLLFIGACYAGIGIANAAVRDARTITRAENATAPTHSTTTTKINTSRATTSRRTINTTRRADTTPNQQSAPLTARNATSISRTAQSVPTTTARTATKLPSIARGAQTAARTTQSVQPNRASKSSARVALMSAADSNTFGTGYNSCRDAYFTCMDQFCAKQNDTYRRCVCSSRLEEIKTRERALSQTTDQLQDFRDLNLDVVTKTAAEVHAMITATAGESAAATARDKSDSAKQLDGIRDVLSSTKNKAMSTQGRVDIAGDINQIWSTTSLTSGSNISNLTGEALYNAVHAQCSDMVASYCPTTAIQNMVISAYGMYIENDCSNLINALDKQAITANSAIRTTERDLHLARLENYDNNNSSSINDCVASVRSDLTANSACGPDFVHCLDVTGRYLNHDTGEPIYSADFYQLELQISLTGDILNNQSNRLIVAELNNMRPYAKNSLNSCTDLADDVWAEFMRQAIREIYQGQQKRIRAVKDNCLDVVNKCYDEQSKSLKDFSNVKDQLLLGQRLELSEEMCREKLTACSNLYGGNTTLLVEAMRSITEQKIEQNCQVALQEYAKDLCAVSSADSLHAYPYGCRTYAPGAAQYAKLPQCYETDDTKNTTTNTHGDDEDDGTGYVCPTAQKYTSCHAGYYMCDRGTRQYNGKPQDGNDCCDCSEYEDGTYTCNGGTNKPYKTGSDAIDCADYIGSMYQKMVRYAMQACMRPSMSDISNVANIPATVLSDVNVVMDSVKQSMSSQLAKECDRLGGVWININWDDTDADNVRDHTQHKKFDNFYNETGASDKWGYCAQPDTTADYEQGNTGGSGNDTPGASHAPPYSSTDDTEAEDDADTDE